MRFKEYFRLYTEGASAVLFHHTYIRNLAKILDTNKFKLTFSLSGKPDRENLKDDAFYMSFSRIRWSGYNHGSGFGSAIIQVDGSKLNQRYKVEPIDYWRYGFEDRIKSAIADEQEDRLMYNKSSIPAIPYIQNVSILVDKESPSTSLSYAIYISGKCKELNIPCYVYNDFRAFKLGDKKRTITIDQSTEFPYEKEYPTLQHILKRLRGIKKIIIDPYLEDDEDLEEVYRMLSSFDWKQSLSASFQNIKSDLDSEVREILEWIARMEKRKGKSIFELIKEAGDKRYKRDNINLNIKSLNGLIQFIREGSAPGWASLQRESIPYYIRNSEFSDVDKVLKKATELSKSTSANDDSSWYKIADLLENAVDSLKEKLPK